MTVACLEKLNPEQRRAVERGIAIPDGTVGGPLLIIAGAGSGKTNTLAHRVGHLIVNGADPRRKRIDDVAASERAADRTAKEDELLTVARRLLKREWVRIKEELC